MFRIGDFSKLSRVSVKALRYYDEMGLLSPARVDRFTGYRYYAAEQLRRLNRILALKDLGFSLEQIASLLDEGLPAAELRGMLRMKQSELQQRVRGEQERLARVEARLSQIEKEGTMSRYDVVIKKIEPMRVASIRGIAPSYDQQGHLWAELGAYLAAQNAQFAGAPVGLCHDKEYRERDVDVEVCFPIVSAVPGNERVSVKELPGVETMACLVHRGAYVKGFHEPYGAVMDWIGANGYQITGPNREVYLKGGDDPTDESYVTEIQFPIEKADAAHP